MTVPTAEVAEELRLSLLGGKPIPSTAEIIPVSQLDRINPALGKAAARLGECQISQPIPPMGNATGNAYIVLQRGGNPGSSCQPAKPDSQGFFQRFDEKAGEVFIGILAVGLTGLLIALPFIL
jgi:hypothetical protein